MENQFRYRGCRRREGRAASTSPTLCPVPLLRHGRQVQEAPEQRRQEGQEGGEGDDAQPPRGSGAPLLHGRDAEEEGKWAGGATGGDGKGEMGELLRIFHFAL